MPEQAITTVPSTSLVEGLAALAADINGQIDDVNAVLAVIAGYNNAYADSGYDEIKPYARALAADFNKGRKANKVSEDYLVNIITRSVKFMNIAVKLTDKAFEAKMDAYRAKATGKGGKGVTRNGVISTLVDTQGKKRSGNGEWNAEQVVNRTSKDLTAQQLIAVIAGLQAKLAAMNVSQIAA